MILKTLQENNILLHHNLAHPEQIVSGKIQTDNRLVSAGDVFICIKGYTSDGHDYIEDVRNKQVACVVQEREITSDESCIQVRSSRKAAALMAKLMTGNPTSKFILTGITGTNGKTTTSLLIFNALIARGLSCGWIGTLGYYINTEKFQTQNTTPDIMELNIIFQRMVDAGVEHVVMEVSSHALALDRVYGLEFDYCLFTNLSRDHLDFHVNMQEYADTKALLFDKEHSPGGKHIIVTADKYGTQLFAKLQHDDRIVYSVSESDADFRITNQSCNISGCSFELISQNSQLHINSLLTGRFNILNLALAAATLSVMGFEKDSITELISVLQPVPGRMQNIPNTRNIGVFVDYAHTPEAIENVLHACSDLPHKRILCLMGAGGNRDTGKRPLMLKSALAYSDAVIITDDNPRFEDPCEIINEIVQDSNIWLPWWVIRNREKAIESILRLAQSGDIVVICGKGHEEYQDICGTKYSFSDLEIARRILSDDTVFTTDPGNTELILAIDPLQLEILFGQPQSKRDNETHKADYYTKVSTDSRTIQPDSAYFAIRGESFDGHKFIDQVLMDTTCIAIGDSPEICHPRYFKTANSIDSLGLFCRKYLLMFDVVKVALTGSTGKTTTKELIYNVLSELGSTLKTDKNENNVIGLCKTILNIKPYNRYAVFELGTNHFGEIAQLGDICFPDCSIVLNIGPSHLEFFGDEDGVFIEKSALLNRPVATKFYTADDPRFDIYHEEGISVGFREKASFKVSDVVQHKDSISFSVNSEHYTLPYTVPFYAINAAFAIAIGSKYGLDHAHIQKALNRPISLGMRMLIEHYHDTAVIVDCYNANPVSMQNAIRYWINYDPEKPHIAILGDMLELGETSIDYHQMIGAILSEHPFSVLFTVGQYAQYYHPEHMVTTMRHFDDVQMLIDSNAIDELQADSVVLVKGSHGINLDRLIPILKGRF
ncbi:MAG: UDP-N-acetylmuramoyl-L-alanyl-D-glutamate--2,6-diaminopimelate ligase [Candidatus Cloacimonetes bacterium HGW-Cloacimonetes-1]|nr:MAG: UDP-N-acetylmuramoyl-L-alanyl-D-glutamate--2,6-diaminopimelate ligase [Candidatus Cloacimonetes bacterium HGW-Cloacimonetes-1]